MAELTALSDRELLLLVAADVREVKLHLQAQNNRIAKVETAQQLTAIQMAGVAGALGLGRWLLGVILAVMTAGAAVAGVVLTIVVRG